MILKKYKNFKIFESNEVSEIESLFYILGDEGYILTLTKTRNQDRPAIEIQINCQNIENYTRLHTLEELEEFIDRLKDIGYSIGYRVSTKGIIKTKISTRGPFLQKIYLEKSKLIDVVRKCKKYFSEDSEADTYKNSYKWVGAVPEGLLLVRQDKEFNIYLATIPSGADEDRFYIIAYKSFDDKSRIKCIALRYVIDSESIVIYNNYLDSISKVEGFGISAGDIERELKLNGQTFKLFNNAWHYIEEDWLEYRYPNSYAVSQKVKADAMVAKAKAEADKRKFERK